MFPELLIVLFCFSVNMEGTPSSKRDGELIVLSDKGEENPQDLFCYVGDTLKLTCLVKTDEENGEYELTWHIPPNAQNNQMRQGSSVQALNITLELEHLQENDSGTYVCEAFRNDPKTKIQHSVRLIVKTKKDSCEKQFTCEPNICIPLRYICDGLKDCENGADEAPSVCGDEACVNKIPCLENDKERCIPLSSCCYPSEPNCTTRFRPSCCPNLKKVPDSVSVTNPQHYSDMNFLQTTIYTVIGCAMVFMLIVTILVIAICRVHMRRTLISAFPSQRQNAMNTTSYHRTFTQEMGICDVDVYLNRTEVPGGVLVTYNINNGVQILSEAVDPPPYSEVVAIPIREGPPPPYSLSDETAERLLTCGREGSPKPEARSSRRGLSTVKVSSEPALSTLH